MAPDLIDLLNDPGIRAWAPGAALRNLACMLAGGLLLALWESIREPKR